MKVKYKKNNGQILILKKNKKFEGVGFIEPMLATTAGKL
jgi:hypothetical protein